MSNHVPHRIPLLLACGGSFLALLDVTITNLAVPALRQEFGGESLTSVSWVVTVYMVPFAALLAPAGRMADVLGRRRLFTVGVTTFTVASLSTALAPTFALLILARAVQGVGAAAMVPASLAFVLADTPPGKRASAIGLWSAAGSAAAAAGPTLGGVLVDSLGWRALFLINVPLGAALVWLAVRLPAAKRKRERSPDLSGTASLTAAVGLLVVATTEGQAWGWAGARTIACLLGCVGGVAIALRRSSRSHVPAIDTGLWRSRTYAAANVVSMLFGSALFVWLLAGVLFLTEVWHYSELAAGLAMTPGALAAAGAGITAGRLEREPTPRVLTVGGTLMIAATGLAFAIWLPTSPDFVAVWLPAGLIAGAGMGAVSVGVSTAAALSVAPQSFAAATGLNVAARQVGGAIGIAILAVLLDEPTRAAGSAPFRSVYIFASIACAGAAVAALRLRLATPPDAAAPAVGSRNEDPLAVPG